MFIHSKVLKAPYFGQVKFSMDNYIMAIYLSMDK